MREIRSIARKIRILRSTKAMSINELSDLSGISPRTICRVEAADMVGYNPQLKTIGSLSRALGTDITTLLSTPLSGIAAVAVSN
jgi:transcriptional regulator with XRE-family HTH domain